MVKRNNQLSDYKYIKKIVILIISFLFPPLSFASTLNLNTFSGSGSSTSMSTTAAAGNPYSTVTIDFGSDFQAANICSVASIFGRAGTASCGGSAGGNFNLSTAFPSSSTYFSGITNAPALSSICSTTTFNGTAGTAVCQTGTSSSVAIVGQVISGKQYWNSSGVLQTGTMTNQGAWNLSASFPGAGYYATPVASLNASSQICSGNTYAGLVGTSICQPGTTSNNVLSSSMVLNQSCWNSSGSLITGGMPNKGSWNLTGAFAGSGYYSAVTNTINSSQICASSQAILGVTGSNVCQTGTSATPATISQVMNGQQFYNSTGAAVTGSMANQGSANLNTVAFPGSGYYSAISANLSSSLYCPGSTFLNAAGTANCLPNALLAQSLAQGAQLDYSCAVVNGSAYCWGGNANGQLGNNSYTTSLTPTQVYGLTQGVQMISKGTFHACAIVNGGVKCWGYNANGQLGNNSSTTYPTPVSVLGMTQGVQFIASGYTHNCASKAGVVYCWGSNTYGELGNGTATAYSTPVSVVGLNQNILSLSAGSYTNCAVANGTAQCWGQNNYGQVGVNTTANVLTPSQVSGLTANVQGVVVGGQYSCGTINGAVSCWGYNASGQLGVGSTSTSFLTPVQVTGLTQNIQFVAAGGASACAIVSGAVRCWGSNGAGQLGNGSSVGYSSTPVQVTGITQGAQSLGHGNSHNCAIINGIVKCWGSNTLGQLGNNTTTNSNVSVYTLPNQ